MPDYEVIPQPPTHMLGLLGNLPDIEPTYTARSFSRLREIYGPIYKVDLIHRKIIVVGNYELAKEVMDDDKYEKIVNGSFYEMRMYMKDGLVTAFPHEPNWKTAHSILMPVFGPLGVRRMFPEMLDIASQMILRWDRMGPDNEIDTADDFTRLTFDTIGICAFNFRFNDFYRDEMHPFAQSMVEALIESGKRANRTTMETNVRYWSYQRLMENIDVMEKLVKEIVDDRKKNPRPEINDLLNIMLSSSDPDTGAKLDDTNIKANMLTFLIAGHETTSGTLSYCFHNMLKNPRTLQKAIEEVDTVVGKGALELKHMAQLKYIDACVKETLRINGPIAGIFRHPKEDIVLAGKYFIPKEYTVNVNFPGLHMDTKIWGEDAKDFKPERMLDWSKIPSDAWKPYGIGIRSCIGRTFAEQEMIMNIALILQHFQVDLADPNYQLVVKSSLTTKPDNFAIKVRRRPGVNTLYGLGSGTGAVEQRAIKKDAISENGEKSSKPVFNIYYGSNAGTCKALAEELQTNAPEHGFEAEVRTLDQGVDGIDPTKLNVIICPSYEGLPPDNARKFLAWLELNKEKSEKLKGAPFALFGVGNSEWATTFHRVPKQISELLTGQGAQPICETGYCDVKIDCVGPWEEWTEQFWKTMEASGHAGSFDAKQELKVNISRHTAPSVLGGDEMSWGLVKSCRSLGGLAVGPEKRELEVQLPAGQSYQTGDYLVVLPYNAPQNVSRVLSRFQLHADDLIDVSGTRKAFLQFKEPVPASDLFGQRVELGMPATQKQLELLIAHTSSAEDKASLTKLHSAEHYQAEVIARNYSVLDILEDHASVALPLGSYIDMLKPLTPRQYSISSCPLTERHHDVAQETFSCTITYDVHEAPAWAGSDRKFFGVASSYLSSLRPGNKVHCFVRRTNAAFHLPSDPLKPVVMISAGTGIAPMMGFVQERMALAAAGTKLGPALMYFGCRDFEHDWIYKSELEAAEKAGVISLRMAYSKRAPESTAEKFKYVGDRIWQERKEVVSLFEQGAIIYLCGSASKLAPSTAEVLKKMYMDHFVGTTETDAEEWLQRQREVRYVTDVFT